MTPQLEAIAMLNIMFESHDGRAVDNAVLTRKDYAYLVQVLAGTEYVLSAAWQPHTVHPNTDEPVTALLAEPDPEEGHKPYLIGIFLWKNGRWIDEITGNRAKQPFFWRLEDSIVAELPSRRCEPEQG